MKTSFLELIAGFTSQQKGFIRWKSQLLREKERRWLCGMVFQFPERHFLGLTISEELRLGHRRLSTEDKYKALRKVGLSEIDIKIAPEKLSGGQQRRLALAVQLLRDPSILLLDEPTAGLDWSIRGEIIELLGSLSKQRLLIIVTHEPEAFKGSQSFSYELKGGRLQELTKLNQ